MTVEEVRARLADKPAHMLVFFSDGENGNRIVSKVDVEMDYCHEGLEVLVIGRK